MCVPGWWKRAVDSGDGCVCRCERLRVCKYKCKHLTCNILINKSRNYVSNVEVMAVRCGQLIVLVGNL